MNKQVLIRKGQVDVTESWKTEAYWSMVGSVYIWVIHFSQFYDGEIDNGDFGGLHERIALTSIKL